MIPKEYGELLTIAHAFVQGECPEFLKEPDWGALMRLSNSQGLFGISAYMISRYGLSADKTINETSKSFVRQNVAVYVRREEQTKQILGKLNEIHVDHGLLKGYVLRNCYPIPELRSFGDVDLVIHSKDRQTVHRMMLDLGFQTKTSWEPVYSYFKGNEIYEFHTEIMEVNFSDKADYRAYFRSVWDHMMQEKEHTYIPELEFHFLYLLCHIAKHISDYGAGLRMYLDIAFYLKTNEKAMDWEWIRGEIDKLCLSEFANTVMTAVEEWFGVSSPIPLKPISKKTKDEFFIFTMAGGTFGKAGRDLGVISLKRTDRNDASVSRWGTLIRRLFPSAGTIEKRYTYLQRKPWLLPAAWIHRLIITRKTIGVHAREAGTIITADEKEVLRLKRLYSNIGL